jgi:hypothetical protein
VEIGPSESWNHVPVPAPPASRNDTALRLWWVGFILVISALIVIIGFTLGVLVAIWM